MPSRSRWLVGSSSSRTSGAPPTRARSPGASSILRTALRPPRAHREAGAAERLHDAPGALVRFHGGQGGGEHVLDGAAGPGRRILRNVADADAAANGAGAAVGIMVPGEDLRGEWTCRSHSAPQARPPPRRGVRRTTPSKASAPRRSCRPPRGSGAVTGPSSRSLFLFEGLAFRRLAEEPRARQGPPGRIERALQPHEAGRADGRQRAQLGETAWGTAVSRLRTDTARPPGRCRPSCMPRC